MPRRVHGCRRRIGCSRSCPAFNEELNLARVVRELRRAAPDLDILVVNDGSTDGTSDLLPTLGIDWLTLPQRVGVGGAVRAGLRYAVRAGLRIRGPRRR